MGYHSSERREPQEPRGYARFTLPPTAKERLTELLRDGDHIYDDGNALRVVAPVPNKDAALGLVKRVERALDTTVNAPRYVPKERALVVEDLEVDTKTKEAYLHSSTPLSSIEIQNRLASLARTHADAFRHIEAVYAQNNEDATYFVATKQDDSITLASRTSERDLAHIPMNVIVANGFVVCPLKPGSTARYHSVTKTLSIKSGKT